MITDFRLYSCQCLGSSYLHLAYLEATWLPMAFQKASCFVALASDLAFDLDHLAFVRGHSSSWSAASIASTVVACIAIA